MKEYIETEECICHNIGEDDRATFHKNGDVTAEVRVILHIVNPETGKRRSVTTIRRMRMEPQ